MTVAADASREAEIWRLLAEVHDPELPVVSVVDLGIIRHVRWPGPGGPSIGITPTYCGCPATEAIRAAVQSKLAAAGIRDARIETVLSPPWSSAWLTPAAHRALKAHGIAPPQPGAAVRCPRCDSDATELVSEFGATPCQAHYRCTACLEPFDRFKCT
ncbi:MAG TPA: 1,2-phenylacetyl-CoA epoxidase subunit PaaD [Steroidobacteraceae bacterium]|nr:1,2-phenylacetyl-CoA epoxidase subunit PaaD [Steroidobacteraceae bacterium]